MGVFSVFRDKQKKNKETPTVNSHYTKLGRYTAFVRYACIISVVVFAVYSLSFHSTEISIDNFRYMLKFINLGEEADQPAGTLIEFDGTSGNRGLIFKGDLAVLNENGLNIIGWDGENILSESFSSDHPKVTENGSNLFCYDIGGKEVRIFNSYTLIHKESFDYPIRWVEASEDGGFAVVSAAKSYRSAVYIYDKEFRLVCTSVTGDKYIDFCDIADNGKDFITASHYSEGGNIVTLITKGRSDSDETVLKHSFAGEIPLGLSYTENGYCLLTSDKMRMYDNNDNLIGEVDFTGKDLLSGRVFGNKALITYRLEGLSGGTEVVVYGLEGNAVYSRSFETAITDAVVIGNSLYALYPGILTISDTEANTVKSYSIPTSYSSFIIDGEKIILFSENRAEYFSADTFEEVN